MARVLLLYATTEGHTERIALRVADALRGLGHVVALERAEAQGLADLHAHDAVVVGASVHYGRHPAALAAQLRSNAQLLEQRPCAFFSVSLSARSKPPAAQRYLRKFLRQAAWRPQHTAAFAGALQYSKYGRLKRLVMTLFAALAGSDTDTSRDYEYTDWDEVDRFSRRFAELLHRQ